MTEFKHAITGGNSLILDNLILDKDDDELRLSIRDIYGNRDTWSERFRLEIFEWEWLKKVAQ